MIRWFRLLPKFLPLPTCKKSEQSLILLRNYKACHAEGRGWWYCSFEGTNSEGVQADEMKTLKPLLCVMLLVPAMAIVGSLNVRAGATPPIKVQALNDYLIYFFDGRRPTERYAKDWNWFDDAAMKLGVGTYAIHSGDEAIVYDTFTSVPQAKFVRDYLEKMGIKKFTVVHSHWHLDHIAGDAVYDDSDVIATSLTRDALVKQRADIEFGKVVGTAAHHAGQNSKRHLR